MEKAQHHWQPPGARAGYDVTVISRRLQVGNLGILTENSRQGPFWVASRKITKILNEL